MIFNIHAGHNPDGKIACGAIGLIKESSEARKVKDEVIRLLKQEGHVVYDCTVDNGTSQNDVLKKIVNKCNQHKVDLDVSIHFNAGANDNTGNGKSCGTEVLVYRVGNSASKYATNVVNKISKLGFRNRGVKSSSVYVLRKTNSPAILIECCFVDDADDIKLYNHTTMAKAIVEGILNKTLVTENKKYGVNICYFSTREKAENFSKTLTEKEYAYNEIYQDKNGFGIKVSSFGTKQKAEDFKKKLNDKYCAYSVVYEV